MGLLDTFLPSLTIISTFLPSHKKKEKEKPDRKTKQNKKNPVCCSPGAAFETSKKKRPGIIKPENYYSFLVFQAGSQSHNTAGWGGPTKTIRGLEHL